jgi:ketosteroid isomerase-like protein
MVGRPPVDHYMTRATVVFAKEKDSWKIRAMHWSPISGGQGTSNISVKK